MHYLGHVIIPTTMLKDTPENIVQAYKNMEAARIVPAVDDWGFNNHEYMDGLVETLIGPALGEVMDPYDESKEIEQYEDDCPSCDKDSPNPDCEECEGTGKAKYWQSPISEWDWWQVGGRYHEDGGDFFIAGEPHRGCYQVLVPGGEWAHMHDKYGPYVRITDEMREEWDKEWAEIMEQHKGMLVIVVDMHR